MGSDARFRKSPFPRRERSRIAARDAKQRKLADQQRTGLEFDSPVAGGYDADLFSGAVERFDAPFAVLGDSDMDARGAPAPAPFDNVVVPDVVVRARPSAKYGHVQAAAVRAVLQYAFELRGSGPDIPFHVCPLQHALEFGRLEHSRRVVGRRRFERLDEALDRSQSVRSSEEAG